MSPEQEIEFEELRKRIFGGRRKNVKTLQIYREACTRSHRILGAYLALWAWKKRVDCVALDRSQLLPYLNIERAMREERIRWLATDIKDFFPHQKSLLATKTRSYHSLYLSRFVFPDGVFEGLMSTDDRVEHLSKFGLRASLWRRKLPTEGQMVIALAKTATGG